MTNRRVVILFLFFILCASMFICRRFVLRDVFKTTQVIKGKKTVQQRVDEYGDIVQQRLAPDFQQIGVPYPPKKIVFIGLKAENVLEVWVADEERDYSFLRSYPILKASGTTGPKLKEGDRQVPEGLYRIESLNPNSRFHLSLRINYPNDFDKKMAAQENRTNLGGDIMIHGNRVSIGCLAMGDQAAEDLFVLAAETGRENIAVILSPQDFRMRDFEGDFSALPNWTPGLYDRIRSELLKFPH